MGDVLVTHSLLGRVLVEPLERPRRDVEKQIERTMKDVSEVTEDFNYSVGDLHVSKYSGYQGKEALDGEHLMPLFVCGCDQHVDESSGWQDFHS